MKTFFTRLFVVLGVVLLLLLGVGAYLWIADPFQIRPLVSALQGGAPAVSTKATSTQETGTTTVEKKSILSPTQKKALEAVGIDPAIVPTSLTPQQQTCLIEKIGADRVAEIKKGGAPTTQELLKGRGCLQ